MKERKIKYLIRKYKKYHSLEDNIDHIMWQIEKGNDEVVFVGLFDDEEKTIYYDNSIIGVSCSSLISTILEQLEIEHHNKVLPIEEFLKKYKKQKLDGVNMINVKRKIMLNNGRIIFEQTEDVLSREKIEEQEDLCLTCEHCKKDDCSLWNFDDAVYFNSKTIDCNCYKDFRNNSTIKDLLKYAGEDPDNCKIKVIGRENTEYFIETIFKTDVKGIVYLGVKKVEDR